jgi:prepilin-type N-terminal cleavage/methylation domain-containing protein
MKFKKNQGGFTLIEILVALVIITLLVTAIASQVDLSHSRADTLIAQMTDLGNANQRLKADTGCYVNMPQALYDNNTAQQTANNYCGVTFSSQWNGPYVSRFSVSNGGAAKLDKIAPGATMSFGQEADSNGGQIYFVHADGIPADIVKQALQTCNGSNDTSATFENNKCRVSIGGGGGAQLGTVDMLYDQTR